MAFGDEADEARTAKMNAAEHMLMPFEPVHFYRPKRSFGQGNIFTSVCHSFCSQGGGWVVSGPRGCLVQGGLQFWGVSNFLGGGGFPNFRGVSKFLGGSPNFRGSLNFRGGSPPEYGQRSAGTHPTGMHSC